MAQREDLMNRDPRRTDFAHKLAVSYARLGDVHLEIGDVGRARDFFKLSVEVTEQLVARDPSDYQVTLGLSGRYQRMALVDNEHSLTWLNLLISTPRSPPTPRTRPPEPQRAPFQGATHADATKRPRGAKRPDAPAAAVGEV